MNLGKKILSALVDIEEDPKQEVVQEKSSTPSVAINYYRPNGNVPGKFIRHFDELFRNANLPGPDYFELNKMLEAMQSIPDEKSRYVAAFAGLSAQGLGRQKLLDSAATYLQVLNDDAYQFKATVDSTLQEKVNAKQQIREEKALRIQQLGNEIQQLQEQISVLEKEILANEEKIRENEGGYQEALLQMKHRISTDIEKIKQHIS